MKPRTAPVAPAVQAIKPRSPVSAEPEFMSQSKSVTKMSGTTNSATKQASEAVQDEPTDPLYEDWLFFNVGGK